MSDAGNDCSGPPLLVIEGEWRRGDGPSVARRAIDEIVVDPSVLTDHYCGLKNYAQFSYQGIGRMKRWYGPKHGHVVSRIEAHPAWRDRLSVERPPAHVVVAALNAIRDAAGLTDTRSSAAPSRSGGAA